MDLFLLPNALQHTRIRNKPTTKNIDSMFNVHPSKTFGGGCRWCFDFSRSCQSMHCMPFIWPYVSHRFPSLTLNLIFCILLHFIPIIRFNVASLLIWIDDDAEGVARCACFGYKFVVVSNVYIAFAPALVKWEYLCVKKTN